MNVVEVTIKLPEDLIERAKATGIAIEDETEQFIALLETQIERRNAGKRLRDTMDQLWALADKPTPEEIDAEIRTYRQEKRDQQRSDSA